MGNCFHEPYSKGRYSNPSLPENCGLAITHELCICTHDLAHTPPDLVLLSEHMCSCRTKAALLCAHGLACTPPDLALLSEYLCSCRAKAALLCMTIVTGISPISHCTRRPEQHWGTQLVAWARAHRPAAQGRDARCAALLQHPGRRARGGCGSAGAQDQECSGQWHGCRVGRTETERGGAVRPRTG